MPECRLHGRSLGIAWPLPTHQDVPGPGHRKLYAMRPAKTIALPCRHTKNGRPKRTARWRQQRVASQAAGNAPGIGPGRRLVRKRPSVQPPRPRHGTGWSRDSWPRRRSAPCSFPRARDSSRPGLRPAKTPAPGQHRRCAASAGDRKYI
ncbi:hypothetical protein DVDV_3096 [Desulfovibrio sp. DV]|nr:hypothetical protein DVDV_3096 [Desulfovibrio sp. DV]